ELTTFLQTKLPEYMVPSSFVLLEKLPLTANGKVDRRSLPKPEWQPSVAEAHTFVAPATPLEQHLARIWCEILKLERVGLHDNFFRLGGHSLLATRIMLKIRDEFQVELPLRALFNAPTLAELAQAVEKALRQGTSREMLPALPRIVPVPDQRYQPFPLTDLQQAYLLGRTDLFALGNVSTHLYLEFESEQLDLERFTLAWQKLIQRHDMLRVVILSNDQQQVLEHVPPYQIETLDLRGRDHQYIQAELERIRQRLSHQVIQADRWPLFEICAARLDERRTRLFISIDALAYDYGSWRILYRELGLLYENPDAQLVPLELTFRDYILAEAALEETELYKRSRDYWWKRLPDLYPAPELPLVQNAATLARPQFVRREAHLSREDWRRLKTLSTQAGVTPSVVLLTALTEVMAAWSKKPRFTMNVPRMQRLPLHPQVNDVVGIFSSFILLEVDCSRNETFQQRARRIQAQLWDDINHQYINGISIIRELIRLRGGFSGPLMPVVFTSTLVWDKTLESDETEQPGMLESILREIHSISQTPQVWIDQQVFERGGELFFNWDSIDELFPEGLLDDMFGAYCGLLRHLLQGHTWLEEIPCLTPASQLALREQINDNAAPIPDDLLHELFAKQAAARPEHPAIITPEIVLTYRELAERVNRLAHWLRAAGVRSDQLVAIVMNKGWEQVVAAQAILTAGGAYVPFDPYLPRERLHALLEQSQVGIVLTQSWLESSLPWPAALKLLSVDTEDLASWPATSLPTVQHMDNLAYVIYTSGSTGSPKGVMIAHRGVVNCITQANARFAIGPDDRLLSLSNLHHDFSVYDVFGVLAAGGTLVLPERGGEKDSVHWVDLVQRYQVTLWAAVPAMMEMLLEQVAVPTAQQAHPLRSLRLVWMGGDWIPLSIPERLLASVPGIQVVSLGGPTETTLFNIWYPIERLDPAWKSIPYGRPLANTRYYVLNERLQQCPTWVAGELYCAGVGLARGYLGDEERTRARFIHHPQTGERLYRTGDLGRYLPDGNIEFLGRDDFQVKIRGYRIELGEIEAALAQHEGVHTAVVSTYNETQQASNLRLVAYLVPEPPHAPTPEELRAFLKTKLPEHMLPALFINLPSLPLTSSGKIDRRALPAPQVEESAHERRAFVAPRDPVEEVVAGIWADVFGHKQIGVYDNFFDLGGHSMMATKIVARLRELFQGKFSIRTLFEKLTVAGVAEALRAHEEIAGSVEKIAR
ncbi:MAG TPA: amino acid adenylation domain-containing protein, partial [Ktedonobacteraceae bacterium]|nr:amino acid adenylation domain-containing protein [Ktedonobacteraceae bacterium]